MTLNEQVIGIISIAMNVTLTNVSVYCTASERTLLQWLVMSTDHPAITFVNFFPEKYLLAVYKYIMVIPVRVHCVLGRHLIYKSMNWGLMALIIKKISQGAGLLFKSSNSTLPGQYFCCVSVVYTIVFTVQGV